MTAAHASEDPRLTPEEFSTLEPDAVSYAFGDVEIVDGAVVRLMAQSEAHARVVCRLVSALENARDPAGPRLRVGSDVAVRFPDTDDSRPDHRLNVRYPDIFVRDCEPYRYQHGVRPHPPHCRGRVQGYGRH